MFTQGRYREQDAHISGADHQPPQACQELIAGIDGPRIRRGCRKLGSPGHLPFHPFNRHALTESLGAELHRLDASFMRSSTPNRVTVSPTRFIPATLQTLGTGPNRDSVTGTPDSKVTAVRIECVVEDGAPRRS